MTAHLDHRAVAPLGSIPLLDASSLPSPEDWALLESLNGHPIADSDFEPDLDRFGRFGLLASLDE